MKTNNKVIKYRLNIEIYDIWVDDRYFGFRYKIKLNGKTERKDYYESDWCNGMSKRQFKSHLENRGALDLILEQGL